MASAEELSDESFYSDLIDDVIDECERILNSDTSINTSNGVVKVVNVRVVRPPQQLMATFDSSYDYFLDVGKVFVEFNSIDFTLFLKVCSEGK